MGISSGVLSRHNRMLHIAKQVQNTVRKWGFFEYLLIVLVCLFAGTALYLVVPRSKYVTVAVRVANRELYFYNEGAPPAYLSTQYVPGLEGKDVFGRLESKILSVDSFPHTYKTIYGTAQTVIVHAKVAASYNARHGTYKYRGVTIQMGDWIRVEVGPVMVEGIVVDINEKYGTAQDRTVKVRAQLKTEDPLDGTVFMGTTGVDPYIADAISVGDAVRDGSGNALATVLEKQVTPSRTVVGDLYGNLFERPHPRKVDVTMVLELKAQEIGGTLYFLDGQPLKINSRVPLYLSAIFIEPRITEIIK